MTTEQVIPLASAKDWLKVDFDDDATIQRLIDSALSWIEKYTCHYLRSGEVIKYALKCPSNYPEYPIISYEVKDSTGMVLDPQPPASYGSTRMYLSCPVPSKVTLQVGYEAVIEIPGPLLEGAYKLITYLYENRDSYSVILPVDIQMLINPYRRSASL